MKPLFHTNNSYFCVINHKRKGDLQKSPFVAKTGK